MQSKPRSAWPEGLAINLFSNFVSFIVGCGVAYLEHEGSKWVPPLIFGALAWLLTMGIWVVARVFKNVPVRRMRITDNNLQEVLRNWLDDIGLKVQSAKEDAAEFIFIVTTDGGSVISILRHKTAFPEYLTFRADFKNEVQSSEFSTFTVAEKAEARLAVKLELARAVMGYVSADVLCEFTLFKRIPISPSLSIEEVSRTLWEVEAALTSVFVTGAMMLLKKKNKTPSPP